MDYAFRDSKNIKIMIALMMRSNAIKYNNNKMLDKYQMYLIK